MKARSRPTASASMARPPLARKSQDVVALQTAKTTAVASVVVPKVPRKKPILRNQDVNQSSPRLKAPKMKALLLTQTLLKRETVIASVDHVRRRILTLLQEMLPRTVNKKLQTQDLLVNPENHARRTKNRKVNSVAAM